MKNIRIESLIRQKVKEKSLTHPWFYGVDSLLHGVFILLIMMFVIDHPLHANDHSQISKGEMSSVSAGKWHPKMFYILLPDLNLSFRLPYEPDQSGVYNLFFISKESGEILLPDTIKEKKRYYTPFSSGSRYDVVLLYNNGKYVKCKNIVLKNNLEVDMRNQRIKRSDSVSEQWRKTLRSFDYSTYGGTANRIDRPGSKYVTRGYVFSALGYDIFSASNYMGYIRLGNKWTEAANDGYFEFDNKDDAERSLSVGGVAHDHIERPNITVNSGLILVLPVSGKATKYLETRTY